ncbi:sodium- and chloride-dependent taurine transporter-like [Biomphalaria glabrata]|uniref:Transporter n=2 Tax=Biomphalaria glabrata TaxID=6526 RepID=A0A9W3B7M0_BIOGL|nr:sodium- and chloride-dependent taurine transporter-like [Biomphalaria glabrata]
MIQTEFRESSYIYVTSSHSLQREELSSRMNSPDQQPNVPSDHAEDQIDVPPNVTRKSIESTGSERRSIRETWTRAVDFLVACIGFSVGLGNVWRFPYLCYKNGGGAFLIPYIFSVLFGGIPLFYLEVAVGQYMSKGGLQAWNLVPLFQGIGLASAIIVFYLDCYYNVILTWIFYYFFASFTSELPWQNCNNEWNTKNCSVNFTHSLRYNRTEKRHLLDPVTEYWENKVLGLSSGLHEMGKLKWDLALCLAFVWLLVFLCICKGIKSSGKVMYVTATSPYVLLFALLIKNTTLDGAKEGIAYYVTPNFTLIRNTQVWVDAGTQIFFSSSIALGTLTALGSYNKFNHNSYRDSLIFTCVNSGTSILSGFIVFSILGFVAKQQGKDIKEVAESGPGLAFIAYPNAVVQLPYAPFWSACFFLTLILLGLDSQFVGVEGVITTFVDQYPNLVRKGHRKVIFIAASCVTMYLIGLSMVFEGGMYVFQLFDYYSGSRTIVLVGLLELVAISYVYGIRRFYENVMMMVGHSWLRYTLPYMLICWSVISPIFCLVLFILSTREYTDLTYERSNKRIYVYPQWGVMIGWTMAVSTVIWIPIVGIFKFVKNGATWEVFKLLLVPYHLHPHQMRPEDASELNLKKLEEVRKGKFKSLAAAMLHESTKKDESPAPDVWRTSAWTIGYTVNSKREVETALE